MARSLLLEPGDRADAPGQVGAEDLHRQSALEIRIHHLEHLGEAPASDQTDHAELPTEREGEAVEVARIAGGTGIETGDLGAEERQAPRPAPGTMRGALTQQGVAG